MTLVPVDQGRSIRNVMAHKHSSDNEPVEKPSEINRFRDLRKIDCVEFSTIDFLSQRKVKRYLKTTPKFVKIVAEGFFYRLNAKFTGSGPTGPRSGGTTGYTIHRNLAFKRKHEK
ncbi:MAG: hypothetical protein A4E62_02781 [Syntrophorhabdus sp. PtaU1.Bin002]|nr:MAG: hypothetical protein A4E58_01224 [Syntrophorhabdus sp. PtaB.Bin006]OPY64934.1 MAG: hypothetical protein A4E62_02781 [Syntrophorhabdus sp. PtaU1.Bin002]